MLKRISLFIVVAVVIIVSGCSKNKVSINDAENTETIVNQQQDKVVNNTEPTPETTYAPTATPELIKESIPTPEAKLEPTPNTTEEPKTETTPITTPEPSPEPTQNEPKIEEEIPVAPIATPTPTLTPAPVTTAEPTPTPIPAEEPEVIEEEDKKEVETPTANITIIEDVDLSQDLKDLWNQYPDHHFNVKDESYIYYQSRDNFVKIHINKSMDGSYMISASQTNGAKDMNASQFEIIKRVLEATVENSEELYAKFIDGYNGWYQHGEDSRAAEDRRGAWKEANTSYSDGIEKWKTLGNIEYKFELGGGVKMDYRAKPVIKKD